MKEEIYLQMEILSDKEKFDMYMQCSKKALARMLVEREKPTGIITTSKGELKFIRFEQCQL